MFQPESQTFPSQVNAYQVTHGAWWALTWRRPEFPGWNVVVYSSISRKKKKVVWNQSLNFLSQAFYLQIQEDQRRFQQRFAWRLRQEGKGVPSLPDEAFRRNVVEIVFGLPVFVNKMSSFSPVNVSLA